MSSPARFIITGITTGGSPNRLEINDFVQNDKFFSLYVQALQVMSSSNQAIVQSFFSVAGIHGLPFQPWDGVLGNKPFNPNSNQWGGYCTHGSTLFPTWHRPYVMLYEQILQQHAVEIAATYTVNTQDWNKAAADLRQPYWDWASNAIPPPEVISQKQVKITNNTGKQVTVDNPLFHYKFHPIDRSFPDPYSNWPTTLRQPTSDSSNATDDIQTLQETLASEQSNITMSTYNLLTRVHTWPAFSNHSVDDGGSSSNSLEAIHDGIHVDVGGQGHMADPSVAAFDPIFFLHHCNVDRLLSLWAALNPGKWVTPGPAEGGGSFTTPPGTRYDQTSALTPFWSAQTSFWASTGVTVTSKLGYSYPEFNGLDPANTAATSTAIGNIVNQLYGGFFSANSFAAVPPSTIPAPIADTTPKQVPLAAAAPPDLTRSLPAVSAASHNPPSTHSRSLAAAPASHNPPSTHSRSLSAAPASHNPAPSHHHPSSTQAPVHHMSLHPTAHVQQSTAAPNHGVYDWTARVEFKKYELGSSFSVLIFIGQVPENPKEWRVSPSFVGSHHAFVNSAASHCANCTNQQDLVVEGFVHLNRAIAQHSGLPSLDPEVVEPYLTQNLHWRVLKTNGEVVQLQSLEVAVIATPLTYPPGSIFPVPGQANRHNRITHGRNGGSRHA